MSILYRAMVVKASGTTPDTVQVHQSMIRGPLRLAMHHKSIPRSHFSAVYEWHGRALHKESLYSQVVPSELLF